MEQITSFEAMPNILFTHTLSQNYDTNNNWQQKHIVLRRFQKWQGLEVSFLPWYLEWQGWHCRLMVFKYPLLRSQSRMSDRDQKSLGNLRSDGKERDLRSWAPSRLNPSLCLQIVDWYCWLPLDAWACDAWAHNAPPPFFLLSHWFTSTWPRQPPELIIACDASWAHWLPEHADLLSSSSNAWACIYPPPMLGPP